MKAGRDDQRGREESGREDSGRGGRETTEGGQHPTSNIQRSTSKGQGGRRDAVYDLEERLLAYAVRVVRAVDLLPKSRGADHLGGQLLRSGTSPALNHGEAQAAESLNDFIHKMKICLRELRESPRTLRIIQAVPLTSAGKDAQEVISLIAETEELIRIFYTSIRTALSRRDPRGGDGSASSRVREDSPALDPSTSAGLKDEWSEEIDPITGARPWMLNRADARKPARSAARRAARGRAGNVGCRMLDVDGGVSNPDGIRTKAERGEAPR